MFGYIKPAYPELLVKQYELYKAVYCGICEATGRITPFLSLALSYDFVYLAMVRSSLCGEKFTFKTKRCIAHPFKKRKMAVSSPSIDHTAKAALILTVEKLDDDIRDCDTPFFKKLVFRIYRSILMKKLKKLMISEPCFKEIYESSKSSLDKLVELETEKCDSIDDVSAVFSSTLKELCSFGLEGNSKLIAGELSDVIGRLIYIFDALDDVRNDEKNSSFNPLLNKYGSSENAIANMDILDLTISMYIEKADNISALLPADSEVTHILRNIASMGLSAQSASIIKKVTDKSHKKSKKGNLNDRSL
ncbi:MAG: hypothetical protein E7665_08265 [Ruminococcaceae bacterium]|nr:hypothetical protein [Oscillospiraceae bacterium]